MKEEDARRFVYALIASGRLPMPSFDVQNQEQWAAEVKQCVDNYVRLFKQLPKAAY